MATTKKKTKPRTTSPQTPAPPDWESTRQRSGGNGWHAGLVRFYPAPDGRKRNVKVDILSWIGLAPGASHQRVEVKPDRNPVWDGENWTEFWDDPERRAPPHEERHARIVRVDRAIRWARNVLREHFPSVEWEHVWPKDVDPSTLPDDPAEDAAVRMCACCNIPRCEHKPAEIVECDEILALPDASAESPTPGACRVLVDPGAGPITGTVGADIAVLADMRPEQVGILSRVRALIVERGGSTAHLALVASGMGVAVVLVEDAVTRFEDGATLTISFDADPATVTVQ